MEAVCICVYLMSNEAENYKGLVLKRRKKTLRKTVDPRSDVAFYQHATASYKMST